MSDLHFELREFDAIPVAFASDSTATDQLGPTIGRLLGTVGPAMAAQGVVMTGAPFCRYTGWEETSCTIDAGAPVSDGFVGTETVKSGLLGGGPGPYLFFSFFGPYDKLHAAYGDAEKWMETNSYTWNGDPWDSYITDPMSEPDSSKWQTDVHIPVRKV